MKALCVTLALAVAMVAIAGWAQEGERAAAAAGKSASQSASATTEVKEMQGNVCPVLAGPIDKKYNYTYKGTIYYFCCPVCIEKFKANPEKYIGKMSKKN